MSYLPILTKPANTVEMSLPAIYYRLNGLMKILENLVKEQLGKVFSASEVLETLVDKTGLPQDEVAKMFREDFWTEITPAEFTRLAQLLLDRVTLYDDHIELDIKCDNMASIIEEFSKNED